MNPNQNLEDNPDKENFDDHEVGETASIASDETQVIFNGDTHSQDETQILNHSDNDAENNSFESNSSDEVNNINYI